MGSKVVRVGDIATINSSQYSPKEKWSHIQYLDTGSVTKGSISDLQQLDPAVDKIPSRARRKVFDKSIVYSMVRPNQEHYAFLDNPPTDMLVSTGFSVIDAKTELVSPGYLYYSLTTAEATEHFQSLAEQCVSTYPTLGVGDLSAYEIVLPSLDIQRAIERILGDLDDKIKLNSQLNDYLAELVRAEFSYRFGSGTPTTNLGDVMSISTQLLKPSACAGEIWEHYSIPAFDESRRPVFEPADGIKSNKYVIDNNCILISKLNPSTKRLWLPFCTSERPVCSTEFIVYKPKKPEHKSFYYAAVDSAAFTDFLLAHVTGSTGSRQRTQPKATLNYPTPNPSVEEIEDFCGFADPIIAKWQLNEQESAQLESLRDALLPKLMSGEIDVSEVELPMQPNNHLA